MICPKKEAKDDEVNQNQTKMLTGINSQFSKAIIIKIVYTYSLLFL